MVFDVGCYAGAEFGNTESSVIIVGTGIAGLAAAAALHKVRVSFDLPVYK